MKDLTVGLLGVSLGALLGISQDSRPVEVLEAETAAHRIGDPRPIYTKPRPRAFRGCI